ncbi:hypothetical protein D6C91_03765 [Aureobasidium pullulans]|uniref:Uncharacterized protein n=1 Tax=Aureobasidium pullulans TaxID=5580 RepID=A0A4S9TEH5_AURPU|nr:hypothetical protein D6C91_03765 [Aureobasidium pullulans]
MAGSVQGSAIDDSFETLTNAPDAWASDHNAAPIPVDYQHYVEPGDGRSAVDDRCFTEFGAVEYPHHNNNNMTRPAESDQKRHRSSTKTAAYGKRRPSPSFRIRSKDGDSVVVSNPFVLRKTCRPPPSEAAPSEQTEEASQHSSSSAARSRTFQIRIRGKNGEEAIQEIKRPLHFASQSGRARTTVAGDQADAEEVKYWSASSSHSSPQREQGVKSKSGLIAGPTTLTDFVTDATPGVAPSSIGSSVKMSGALPDSSPAPTPDSSRSRLLPPEKPASSIHDSIISSYSPRYNSIQSSKDLSRYTPSKHSFHTPSQKAVIIVPDDSLEGSVTARSISALSTHAIVSSRPMSPVSCTSAPSSRSSSSDSVSKLSSNPSARQSASSYASTPTQSIMPPQQAATASQHSVVTSPKPYIPPTHRLTEPWPASLSHSKPEWSNPDAYYDWKVPNDSLYSDSTVKSASPPSGYSSHSGGVLLQHIDTSEDDAFWGQSLSAIPSAFSPFPEEGHIIENRFEEITSETTQQSTHKSQSTHHTQSPSSRKSPSEGSKTRSSLTHSRRPSRSASRETIHNDQEWDETSAPFISEWEDKAPSENASRQTVQEDTESEVTAEWEALPSSHRSRTSKVSRESTSHRSRSQRSRSSRRHSREDSEQSYVDWEAAETTEKGSNRTSNPSSAINIQEELLEYLPPISDDGRLPPPMPMLTTIYEEPEPSNFSRAQTMLTQENVTRFARPGAISPHPLSSVSSAVTARKPPTIEPHRLEYQRPYVESNSATSGSSGAVRNGHSRRSSRTKISDEQVYQSAQEDGRGHGSREGVLDGARRERKSKSPAKKGLVGGWKLW